MKGWMWDLIVLGSVAALLLAMFVLPIPRAVNGEIRLTPCPVILPASSVRASACGTEVQGLPSGSVSLLWSVHGHAAVTFAVRTYENGGGVVVCSGTGTLGGCRFTSGGGSYLFQARAAAAENLSWSGSVSSPLL